MVVPCSQPMAFFSVTFPLLHQKAHAGRFIGGAGDHLEVGHGRNAAERFAAEAQRADVLEVFFRHDLAGRVFFESEFDFVSRDAAAVVGDADVVLAARADLDGDPVGAGVDGVLHEFFHDGGRAGDDFAGCDLIGNIRI